MSGLTDRSRKSRRLSPLDVWLTAWAAVCANRMSRYF